MTYKEAVNARFKELFETVNQKGKVAWYHKDGNGRELFVIKGKKSFRMFWVNKKELVEIARVIQLRAVAVILADMEAAEFEEMDIKKEGEKYSYRIL